MTDIEIARNTKLEEINKISKKCGILDEEICQYGKYKAKIEETAFKRLKNRPNGKLILVTAMNPTPLGEGKTTVSIAIADGLNRLNKNAILALREPSLGPVFGLKGRSNWRRECSSCSNGRNKSAFYRRFTCNYNSK